jgi:hypothetical protein
VLYAAGATLGGYLDRHDLVAEDIVGDRLLGLALAARSECILFLAADVVLVGEVLLPIWMSLNASQRPSWTIEWISSASPIRAPNRPVGIKYVARVMFSMPPATTISTSAARIICNAIATALSRIRRAC